MENNIVHAHSLGYPCERRIWMQRMGYEASFPRSTLRIFDMGHAVEILAIKWLEEDGWRVSYNPGSQEAVGFEIPVEGGVISAHPDCWMGRGEGPLRVADIKSMRSAAFAKFKRSGVSSQYPQYVDQLTIYAKATELAQCIPGLESGETIITDQMAIVAVNKDNSVYEIEFVPYSEERWLQLKAKAEKILAMDEMPAVNVPDWTCNYCPYRAQCRGTGVSTYSTAQDGGFKEVDDSIAASLAEEFGLVKEMRHELESREKEINEELRSRLDINSASTLKTGGFLIERVTTKRNGFDSKALERELPDIYGRFTKISQFESIKVRKELDEYQ